MFISAYDFHTAYNGLLSTLRNNGEEACPRGHKVLEMPQPTMWTINQPWRWAPNMKGRRLNIFFALAEVVWMWSGNGSVEFIEFYNSSIKQFADKDLPYFHGSYGKRVRHFGYHEDIQVRPEMPWTTKSIQGPDGTYGVYAGQEELEIDQIKAVINKLEHDIHTRQAVMTLWDPFKDNLVTDSKDYPCNNIVYTQVRENVLGKNQLKMTVVMRSNDLILGTPYNMIQFSHLQALLAGSLGVEVGAYSVIANNLHMYEESYYPEAVRNLVQSWKNGIYGKHQLFDSNHLVHWDMRWSINQFDHFINEVWMDTEARLREGLTEVTFMSEVATLATQFEEHGVPIYWRELFHMLLVWHVRKAKFEGWQEWTTSILDAVNPTFRTLALDFDPTLSE